MTETTEAIETTEATKTTTLWRLARASIIQTFTIILQERQLPSMLPLFFVEFLALFFSFLQIWLLLMNSFSDVIRQPWKEWLYDTILNSFSGILVLILCTKLECRGSYVNSRWLPFPLLRTTSTFLPKRKRRFWVSSTSSSRRGSPTQTGLFKRHLPKVCADGGIYVAVTGISPLFLSLSVDIDTFYHSSVYYESTILGLHSLTLQATCLSPPVPLNLNSCLFLGVRSSYTRFDTTLFIFSTTEFKFRRGL